MFHTASKLDFVFALTAARDSNQHVRRSVTHPTDLTDNAQWFLTADGKTGFGITHSDDEGNRELIAVFSTVKGRGPQIVRTSVLHGANVLDCFDGFLVEFYTKHGWREYDRAPNWTPGNPDVVFLEYVGVE
jgi:hypothetical protein